MYVYPSKRTIDRIITAAKTITDMIKSAYPLCALVFVVTQARAHPVELAGVVALKPVNVEQFIVELPSIRVPTPNMIIRPINPPINGIN